jgi:hypothetical protein
MFMQELAIKDLKEGMLIDLEYDEFADPNGDNSLLANQYLEVAEIEEETPDCIAVHICSFDTVGFPPNHKVKVVANNYEELEKL